MTASALLPTAFLAQSPLVWLDRWQQRRRLARLDAHQLRDIGLTREAAELDANGPFWRVATQRLA